MSVPPRRACAAQKLVLALVLCAPALAKAEPPPAPAPAPRTAASAPAPPEVALPARIDAIELLGLTRTSEFVVMRELPWHPGEVVTRAAFDLGVTRLWNTPIFSRVDAHVVRKGDRTVAVFELEERWPLTPLVEFQSGGNATWFHLGASHRNVLGKYLELEGFYEYFNGQSGGRVWFRDARLFDERLELKLGLERLMRPRPE